MTTPTLDANRMRIAKLMLQGYSAAACAEALGLSASYISELQNDKTFADYYNSLQIKKAEAESTRIAVVDKLIDRTLVSLSNTIQFVTDPSKLVNTTKQLVEIKQMLTPQMAGAQATVVVNNIVSLQVPKHLAQRIVKTAQNEVIEVDGVSLVAKPSSEVLKMAGGTSEIKTISQEEFAEAAKG